VGAGPAVDGLDHALQRHPARREAGSEGGGVDAADRPRQLVEAVRSCQQRADDADENGAPTAVSVDVEAHPLISLLCGSRGPDGSPGSTPYHEAVAPSWRPSSRGRRRVMPIGGPTVTTPDRVRWGVLSTARIGRKAVAPAIARSSNGTLLAIASRDAGLAVATAAELGAPRAYGSYDDLLADPDVDAVYVPLPNSQHAAWTIRAAEAGKHVLCEKPLAMSSAECDAMRAAAGAHGVVLMEAFMYRFHPRFEQLLARVQAGELGALRYVQASFSFTVSDPADIRLRRDLGGGSLMDVGCYAVNVARTLMGAEPVEAQALARWTPGGVDEQLAGTLRFDGDRVAQVTGSLAAARSEDVLVVGELGTARLRHAFVPVPGPVGLELHRPPAPPEVIGFEPVDSYQRMVEHVAACVLEGRRPRYDAVEAAANLRTIEALYGSARAGGRVVAVAV